MEATRWFIRGHRIIDHRDRDFNVVQHLAGREEATPYRHPARLNYWSMKCKNKRWLWLRYLPTNRAKTNIHRGLWKYLSPPSPPLSPLWNVNHFLPLFLIVFVTIVRSRGGEGRESNVVYPTYSAIYRTLLWARRSLPGGDSLVECVSTLTNALFGKKKKKKKRVFTRKERVLW